MKPLPSLTILVDTAFAASVEEDGMRRHLGASVIGENCMRRVWYSFRWFDKEDFDGRMLRLFACGQREEEVFTYLLRKVGATVWTHDEKGNQFRVSAFGDHFSGSLDGVATGVPEIPDVPTLLEMKTHNAKSFTALKGSGVATSKPKHFKQMQVYCSLMKLTQALYCAVNKDTDELYFELVPYDASIGSHMGQRAETIIFGSGIPPKIGEPLSWECRFCPMKGVCHEGKEPRRNCRTCVHSTPLRGGGWGCALGMPEIRDRPKEGCYSYQVLTA